MDIVELSSIAGYVIEDDTNLIAELTQRADEFPHARDSFAHCIGILALLAQRNRFDLALPWAENAYRLRPEDPSAQDALARCAELAGDFATAVILRRRLAEQLPDNAANQTGMLEALDGAGRYDEAFALYENLARNTGRENSAYAETAISSDILRRRARYGEMRLRRGDARGFEDFLAHLQFRIPAYAPTIEPEDISKFEAAPVSLDFSTGGGFGDQVLFAALLPRLAQRGIHVRCAVHPDLRDVFAASFAGGPNVASGAGIELLDLPPAATLLQKWPSADAAAPAHISIFHAPLLGAAMPHDGEAFFAPYLRTPAAAHNEYSEDAERIRSAAGGRTIIGITWDRAQRYFPNIVGADEACRTARTSCPFPEIAELLEVPEIREHFHFLALHESDAVRAWPTTIPDNLSLANIRAGEFGRTLAAIELCRAVVSVDMSVANIAAMAGKPVHVMLLPEGDWRWGGSSGSPWMNDVHVHYAPSPAEWSIAVSDVRSRLAGYR